ncbi:hypothetical protein MTO96_045809 [Rhipicephalus appendiculatus]
MFGRDIDTALMQLQPQPAEETPSYTRAYISPREISVRQSVFIRNFVDSLAWIEGTVMERLGHRSWMIKCEMGTFRRHLDHIKPGVDKSQAENRRTSEHGKQRETARQDTVPAPYMRDPPADSPGVIRLQPNRRASATKTSDPAGHDDNGITSATASPQTARATPSKRGVM